MADDAHSDSLLVGRAFSWAFIGAALSLAVVGEVATALAVLLLALTAEAVYRLNSRLRTSGVV